MTQSRKVWLFLLSAAGLFGLVVLVAGFRQGWFSPSETYYVVFDNGEGLNVGTPVSMSGLRIGSVVAVDLVDGEEGKSKVQATVKVQSKYASRIKDDTKVSLGRKFIIGERVISMVAGSSEAKALPPKSVLSGAESLEITDLLSGGRMAPYFETFNKLMEQMRVVIEGDGSKDAASLVDVYKTMNRAMRSVESMSHEVSTIRKDFAVSPEMRKVMAELSRASSQFEPFLEQSNQAFPAVTQATTDFAKMVPELNRALSETIITLQTLQRSFFLSGAAKEVRKEMEQSKDKEKSNLRSPASSQ